MNDSILPRLAAGILKKALEVSPVVVLTGARQTGKSTLVKTLPALRDRPYLTLDDLNIRVQARNNPDDLAGRSPSLTLDEVQRAPDLILAIKRVVDKDRPRRPGRFVLTGSANLLLMKRVSETLAGRATYINLWPLTRNERAGLGTAGIWTKFLDTPVTDWYEMVRTGEPCPEDWRVAARVGGYPTPAHELTEADSRQLWYSGYVQTYLERDLQDLAAIDNLLDFQRLMRASSLRLGNLLNQAAIARDVGIPRPTAHRYLNLLETSFQIVRTEPYAVNRTKRLIKSPKLYWTDTGMALFLSGGEPGGNHLENLVLADLLAWRDAQIVRPNILYWRTASDQEVDFVVEHRRRLLPIEVKATTRPGPQDIRNLQTFCAEYPKEAGGALLLHTGDEVYWLAKGILAAPWWRVL
ncbi:MAG: ATP-binding protein [Acidobacteria bacterium]|nr:ATP-binding protein [Acidobacteriota bacterium]